MSVSTVAALEPSSGQVSPSFVAGEERHTLAILVDNEPGVLARIVGMFSGRGYNIESLTVAEVDTRGRQSRITVVTRGSPKVIEQIKAQIGRIVPVHRVVDLTAAGPVIEREMVLVKVKAGGMQRVECLMLAESYRAAVVDSTPESFVFEITGSSDKIDAFLRVMAPVGVVEVARTGTVGMARGEERI